LKSPDLFANYLQFITTQRNGPQRILFLFEDGWSAVALVCESYAAHAQGCNRFGEDLLWRNKAKIAIENRLPG
jgi:hypothetical protein